MRVTVATWSAVLALGMSSAASAQRDTPRPVTVTVHGRVVGADTLAGVPDVTVSIRPIDERPNVGEVFQTSPTASARSGPDGAFELAGIPTGRYRVFATPGMSAARYLPASIPDPAIDESEPLTLSSRPSSELFVITLARAAAITGQVVDEGGNPMALVSVRVQPASTGDRRVPITSSFGSSSRTDDNGAFRLFGLRPGEYVLVAEVLRMTGVPSAVAAGVGVPAGLDSPYGTTYYPGTTAARDAARIRVASGDEYGPVRFTLSPVRLTIIRAFVVGADGLPASTVSVSIRPEGTSSLGASPTSRTTSSDGTVEFPRMPPGDYVASVSHYGTRGTQFAWAPFTVSDDTGVLTIRLQAGVSIAGQMVFDGQPPARLPSLYVRGVSARGGGGSTSPALVGSDLQYTLRDQFGPTFVRADAPDGWHLKSVLLGGIDITDRPTEFVPDGPAVTVVLTPRASTLAGVVTTPAGVPADAAVLLLSEDSAAWHAMATTTKRTTTTAGDGKYRFEGLRPGRYLVVGTTRDDGLLGSLTTSDFELLSRYATRVTIGEAETRTLDLKRVRLR